MPVTIVCPACKAKMRAPENLIGKAVKCPNCSKPVLVKAAAPTPTPTPPPPPKKPAPKPAPVIEEEPLDDMDAVEDEVEAPRPKRTRPAEVDGDETGAPLQGGPTTDKERGTAMWIHLMPIVLGWCCGIGTWISLFMWISKRKDSAFIDHHGKTWLNWVINLFVISFLFGFVAGGLSTIGGMSGSQTVALIASGLVGLLGLALSVTILIMQIMMAVKAKKGEWAEYKVLFKLLK